MFLQGKTKSKKIKLILLSVIFVILGTIIVIFAVCRYAATNPEKVLSAISERANISIGTVYQEAVRNGVKEWSLNATSVYYIDKKKRVVFQDLCVTFFLKDKSKVFLTADEGVLETDSKDIEVKGNVVVKNDNYSLYTEKLHYDDNKRIIISKAPVKIIGESVNFSAQSMSIDLNTNKALLEGKVRGFFGDDFTI